jgi:hypothetical protein
VCNPLYRRFGGKVWPVPSERLDELEHTLRYANRPLSTSERLAIASVISAYKALVALPDIRRQEIIRELQKGPTLTEENIEQS